MDEYSIKVHKIDPEKHKEIVKGIQRARMTWYPILVFLFFILFFWESIEAGEFQIYDLMKFSSLAIIYLVLAFFYLAKAFSEVKVEMSTDGLVAVEVKHVKIWMDRVTYIREKKNSLWIDSLWFKRIVIPQSIENYEDLKNMIIKSVDPKRLEWQRLPVFWILFVFALYTIATIPVHADLFYLYQMFLLLTVYLLFKFFIE